LLDSTGDGFGKDASRADAETNKFGKNH
jgi:hypothetical protein